MSKADVLSRPMTQASVRLPVLPSIQHPLSGMAHGPAQMDIVVGNAPQSRSGSRPLASEQDYKIPKRLNTAASRAEGVERKAPLTPIAYGNIPEGVEVMEGDPNKTKLPIFGNRSQLENRDDLVSAASSRLSKESTRLRLEVDELEAAIKEKCRSHFHAVQKQFKDNDPQGQGNVNKDALHRIVTLITGKQITKQLYDKLLIRIGLHENSVIHFTDFFAKFRIVPNSAYPQWMTSVSKNFNDRPELNASQVHAILKEKTKQRVLDVADLVPQTNPGGAARILKPEFRNALNKLMLPMNDEEYDKLWKKYDEENVGVVDGTKLMRKLGVILADAAEDVSSSMALPPGFGDGPLPSPPQSGFSARRKEKERQQSLNIERWLRNKFREGFTGMKAAFEEADVQKTGYISSSEFCSVLHKFGLKLDGSHLDEFLARCSLTQEKQGIPYKEFLLRFQDRSEKGIPHKILGDANHRYNKSVRTASPGAKSSFSVAETKLMNLFQKDFLSLIGTFHKIDRLGTDTISQEEFRAAIESRFEIEMSDEEFSNFINHVPLTNDGDVKYAEFMAQFDTNGDMKSLFSESGAKKNAPISTNENGVNVLVLDDKGHEVRSVEVLKALIKDLFVNNYKEIEKEFSQMDEYCGQRLSQETLYRLLKKFDISPQINRGEIRELWKSFLTNKDGKLEWLQFVRTFGRSMKSACFPNAKLNPPKRGDADFSKRSKLLSSDYDILQDSLRQKIDYMWDNLRKEFFSMDPYGTGHVMVDEFKDVLSEIAVQLTESEINEISKKFSSKDGRISYIEFLRPFAMRRDIWRHGNDMLTLLAHPSNELPISDIVAPPHKGLVGITSKLRQKLSGDWKNLRRAFRKLDKTDRGYLSLPEFRNVLKLANVVLDEDEVYHVLHSFDEDLSGRINYNKFLSETFRPETRSSSNY